MQYPPQTGAYKVTTKEGDDWKSFDTARLMISVGNPVQEGEKLEATINWMSGRFRHIIICVNDSLQRYNYLFQGKSKEDAYRQSIMDGSDWIDRNLRALNNASFTLKRWDEWLNTDIFAGRLEEVKSLYHADSEFKSAVIKNIVNYSKRNYKKILKTIEQQNSSYEDFIYYSKQFLFEEIAVFSFLNEIQGHAIDLYPGSLLKAFKVLQRDQRLLHGRNFLRIDYVRNKSIKIQEKIAA
jgi:tRNA-dependent cyclodipeptide synthase